MWKKFCVLMICMLCLIMTVSLAIAVVDRVALPIDINTDTWLSVGTYYHSDSPLDTTKDDFIFKTDEPGLYTFHLHPMDPISEVIIFVKDRYYEKVFEDRLYSVKEDLVYEYYLDGNETYFLRLYALNGFFGEVHFDFTINPPSQSKKEFVEPEHVEPEYDYDINESYPYPGNMDGTGDYVGDRYVVNCDEWVSLRYEPDTSSSRLAKVPFGAKVNDCYEAENGFYFCEYNGTTGYILKKYLSSQAPNPKQKPIQDNRYDLNQYEYRPVVEKGRGALVFQKSPRGSFMKKHIFYDDDYVYVNINWRKDGYAIAYEGGEYGYVDASYIDW